MPEIKKKKGKKGAKDKPVAEAVTEYDNMDLGMLHEVVPLLKQQLEKSMLDRNYVQLERDTIQNFYDISRKEAKDLNMKIALKERALEIMEDNHRVEKRVYMQKVKHLDYEHANNIKDVLLKSQASIELENDEHGDRKKELKLAKIELKQLLAETKVANANRVIQVKKEHAERLSKLREEFETGIQDLVENCSGRLEQFEKDMKLRQKVEVHEMEERKNLHVNTIIQNHEKAFERSKDYFNGITTDNLSLITSLKEDMEAMKKKSKLNQQLFLDLTDECKKLEEPLLEAENEIKNLTEKMKSRESDKFALANRKLRFKNYTREVEELKANRKHLSDEILTVQSDRNDLYVEFEKYIEQTRQQNEVCNDMLEAKVQGLENELDLDQTRINNAVSQTNMTQDEVDELTNTLDSVFVKSSNRISELNWRYQRAVKALQDLQRTYRSKLEKAGISTYNIPELDSCCVDVISVTGPAGLVAR